MTDQTPDYRTLSDGSIDLAHYDRKARALRSRDAFKACRLFARALRSATFVFPFLFQKGFRSAKSSENGQGKPVALSAV